MSIMSAGESAGQAGLAGAREETARLAEQNRSVRNGQLERRCEHVPRCPSADAPDREAAHTVAAHPEQGWSLLCNGVLLFEDTGELLPSGEVIAPHR